MLEPYICSRRSNNVVSKVRGGNKTDFFVGGESIFFVFVVSSPETPGLSSGSDNDGGFGVSFGNFNVSVNLVDDLRGCFNFFFSLSFLSIEMIVGGNCIGSPARMSFFALRMGIQQT